MHRTLRIWAPAAILAIGITLNSTLITRQVGPVPLRSSLDGIAPVVLGARGTDIAISKDEQAVAGMSSYMIREYNVPGLPRFTIYVGYYEDQRQGKTIHSPKNCLPGGGWEPVKDSVVTFATATGPAVVNRYHIARKNESAVAYYWYQGRGRVAHDEFRVKFELLRDAALRGRTEEALVRILVYANGNDVAAADRIAQQVAPSLIAQVDAALPRY